METFLECIIENLCVREIILFYSMVAILFGRLW